MKIEKKSKIVSLVTEYPILSMAIAGELIMSIATAFESVQGAFILFGVAIVINAFVLAMGKAL